MNIKDEGTARILYHTNVLLMNLVQSWIKSKYGR